MLMLSMVSLIKLNVLIGTLWNVNKIAIMREIQSGGVLIGTLWNVN